MARACVGVAIVALVLCGTLWAGGDECMYQSGIHKMEVEGKLDEAITIFQKVVESSKEKTPSLAAKALWQIATCYEKQGKKNEQTKALQQIVDQFPKEEALVKSARGKIGSAEEILKKVFAQLGGSKGYTVSLLWKTTIETNGNLQQGAPVIMDVSMYQPDTYLIRTIINDKVVMEVFKKGPRVVAKKDRRWELTTSFLPIPISNNTFDAILLLTTLFSGATTEQTGNTTVLKNVIKEPENLLRLFEVCLGISIPEEKKRVFLRELPEEAFINITCKLENDMFKEISLQSNLMLVPALTASRIGEGPPKVFMNFHCTFSYPEKMELNIPPEAKELLGIQ